MDMDKAADKLIREACRSLISENKRLRKEIVGWMNWTYYLPESWKPNGLLKTSKQVLKGEINEMD